MHRLAAGGVGEVHLALRLAEGKFRRWAAVKLIHPRGASAEGWIELFRLEARLAARLDDPHVCAVFDFGEDEGTPYLVMEYLHGQSLDAIAKRAEARGGLPVQIAARIIADAARGLAAAHAHCDDDGSPQPVVHRDVSPQNIFVLYAGITKVVDFGIARPMDERSEFTRTGEVRGKLGYMSPQQLRGERPNPSMDIWALGVVLWEICLGRRLFRRGTDAEMVTSVLTQSVPPPRELNPSIPERFEEIVLRCLRRDPSERYGSAMDLARDLEAFLGTEGRDSVSAYLHATFAEEKRARESLLRTLGRDADDGAANDPSEDLTLQARPSSDPGGTDAAWTAPTRDDDDATMRRKAARPLPRSAILVTAIGLSVSLTGIGVLLGRSASSPSPAAPPAVVRSAARAAPEAPPALQPAAVSVGAPASTAPVTPTRGSPGRRPHGDRRGEPRAAHTLDVEVGRLTLRSSIPGTVYEGGRRIGHTPLVAVELSTGRHHLRLVPDDPNESPHEISVEIETSAESTIALHER